MIFRKILLITLETISVVVVFFLLVGENSDGHSVIGLPDSFFRVLQAIDGTILMSIYIVGPIVFSSINKKIYKSWEFAKQAKR